MAERASTRYQGVFTASSAGFRAAVRLDGRLVYLGTWKSERDAALAYDRTRLWMGVEPTNLPKRAGRAGAATPDALRREARLALHRQKYGVAYLGVRPAKGKGYVCELTVDGQKLRAHCSTAAQCAEAYDRLLFWSGAPRRDWNFPDRQPARERKLLEQLFAAKLPAANKLRPESRWPGIRFDPSDCRWVPALRRGAPIGRFDDEWEAKRALDAAMARAKRVRAQSPRQPQRMLPLAPAKRRDRTLCNRSSQYRGVVWEPGQARWRVILWRPQRLHLGYYDDERRAAEVYDRYCRYIGRLGSLNFPEIDLPPTSADALRAEARTANRLAAGMKPFAGVERVKSGWRAVLRTKTSRRSLGIYETPELAAQARDRGARKAWGLNARQNFVP